MGYRIRITQLMNTPNTPSPLDSIDKQILVNLLPEVVLLAQQASSIAMGYYRADGVASTAKADNSPVTAADLHVHDYLRGALASLLSGVPVVSEEDAPAAHPARLSYSALWLLDPLDGTLEFSQGIAEFTINIALIVAGEVKLSVIAVPAQSSIYATCGNGVYEIQQARWQALSCFAAYNPSNGLRVAVSRRSSAADEAAYLRMLGQGRAQVARWVQAGSAYKFVLLLRGEVDVYPRLQPCYEWDTAAGQGLLQASGGGLWAYTQDGLGQPFTYNQRPTLLNGPFVALRHQGLQKLF